MQVCVLSLISLTGPALKVADITSVKTHTTLFPTCTKTHTNMFKLHAAIKKKNTHTHPLQTKVFSRVI